MELRSAQPAPRRVKPGLGGRRRALSMAQYSAGVFADWSPQPTKVVRDRKGGPTSCVASRSYRQSQRRSSALQLSELADARLGRRLPTAHYSPLQLSRPGNMHCELLLAKESAPPAPRNPPRRHCQQKGPRHRLAVLFRLSRRTFPVSARICISSSSWGVPAICLGTSRRRNPQCLLAP